MPHDMLPAGEYKAVAVDAVLGLTGTGKEQIAVTFEVTAPEAFAGKRITWYGFFTEKTADRTLESLRYCGWRGNDLSVFEYGSQTNPAKEGFGTEEVIIVVEHEPDQEGQMRARVRWVNRAGGGGVKEKLDANRAKALAARMKARLAMIDQQLKSEQRTQMQAPATGGSDDEIPF